ncbi:MAG TPA: CPBP family intramembrane glutamic endopeptidase [Bacteroidia bacterium]|jgi:membrane protease YdiL (CAAX protease family)
MVKDLKPIHKLLILLGWLFVIGLLSVVGSGSDTDIDSYGPRMISFLKFAQVLAVLFIFIIPAFLFSLLFTRDRLRYPRWNVSPPFLLLLAGALVFVVGMPMIAWLEQLNKKMILPASMSELEHWMQRSESMAQKLTDAFLADTSVKGLIVNLFVIAFVAAFSEELFFRGVLQKAFFETTRNIHVSVWITAALFSAFHLQFYGFLPRMLMGALLGYLFAWSGSLWVNIFAHFVNNGVAVVISWLIKRGTIAEDMQNGPVEVSAVAGLVSMALVAALLYFVYRKRRIEKEVPLDEIELPMDRV